MRAGDVAGAKQCFESAVVLEPRSAEANFNMGLFYEVLHQPDSMVLWMEKVLDLEPQHYMALVLLAKYQERVGDFGKAANTYRKAMECSRDHDLALGQMQQIVGDKKVSLDPVSAWPGSMHHILAEDAGWRFGFPDWQENFLHPSNSQSLGTPALADGIAVWDSVLQEPLLTWLTECVDDMAQFVTSNSWLSPGGNLTTAWLPREKERPEVAPELAVRLLMQLLGEEPADFRGVEWWAKLRRESRGQGLHYDQSEADEPEHPCMLCGHRQRDEWVFGNPWRPRWSSVLFLSDAGGPTVILEQLHTAGSRNDPCCPQRGFAVVPKRGRWVVFRGDLFHGCMPLDHAGSAQRKVLVFNLWRDHQPPPNHCNSIDYQRQPALQKLLLTPEQLRQAEEAEAAEAQHDHGDSGCCKLVVRQRCASTLEMPHSTCFGYLPFALPMPRAAQLRTRGGFWELDWRAAADDSRRRSELPMMSDLDWQTSTTLPLTFEMVD